jgi:hypothetical protein
MNRPHIIGIQIVAQGLGDLVDAVVFVGGAVAEFYATGLAVSRLTACEDTLATYNPRPFAMLKELF